MNPKFKFIINPKQEEPAILKGFIYDEGKICSLTSIEGPEKLRKRLLNAVYIDCLKYKRGAYVSNIGKRKIVTDYILDSPFKLKYRKALYFSNLKDLNEPKFEFNLKNISEVGEQAFADLLFDATIGDPLENLEHKNAQIVLDELKAEPGSDENFWNVAYLDNEPIGIVLVALIPEGEPGETEGTLHYFGILQKHRGKGYGLNLHRKAMQYLTEIGATIYYGSTSTENAAMQKIFQKNNCEKVGEQLFFTT